MIQGSGDHSLKIYLNSEADLAQNHRLMLDFRKVIQGLSQIGIKNGIRVVPYFDENLIYFSRLDLSKKEMVVKTLSDMLEIYSQAIQDKASPFNSLQLSWYAIKKFGFIPRSDFFDKIKPEDFLEIYTMDSIQVFRDFNFYKFCSYSIEDITTRCLTELVKRDQSINKKIYEYVGKFLSGEIRSTIIPDIPEHLVEELDSPDRIKSRLKIKYYSPLFDSKDRLAALAVIGEANLVSKNAAHTLNNLNLSY